MTTTTIVDAADPQAAYREVFPAPDSLTPARLANNPPPDREAVLRILTAARDGATDSDDFDTRALIYLYNARCITHLRPRWSGGFRYPQIAITPRGRRLLALMQNRRSLLPAVRPCMALVPAGFFDVTPCLRPAGGIN